MTNYISVRLNMKSNRVHWADIKAESFEDVLQKIKHNTWVDAITNPNTEMQEDIMISTSNIESVLNQGRYEAEQE